MRPLYQRLLLLFIGSGILLSASAQTARIAHFSHSGSVETLADDAAPDNFGIPGPDFRADSIRLLSETTALEYGNWRETRDSLLLKQKTQLIKFENVGGGLDKRGVARYYREYYPNVKLIGFDSAQAPVKAAPRMKTKQKTKRKRAAAGVLIITLPAAPGQSGTLVLVVAVLGLAGIGWLLGGERRPMLKITT